MHLHQHHAPGLAAPLPFPSLLLRRICYFFCSLPFLCRLLFRLSPLFCPLSPPWATRVADLLGVPTRPGTRSGPRGATVLREVVAAARLSPKHP